MINTQSFKLDIKKPTIPRLRVVNGDTANVFVITIQDDGNAVALDATLHKVIAVFTRADGEVYTQDADTGVTFTTAGVVTIDVHSSSFRTGTNKVCLQVYKREDSSATVYPLLCTTSEAQFAARASAIPDSGAPNAPSQLPMLEQLISDAQDAIDDCEDATQAANDAADAANDAAGTLNALLADIDDEPTSGSNHLVKSGGVYSFVNDKVQEAADDVRAQIPVGATANPLMDGTAAKGTSPKYARQDHVHPHDTSKQDVLTFDVDPTQNSNNPVKSGGVWYALEQKQDILVLDNAPTAGSNNPVKSGGIKTAIDTAAASAAKKNVYFVKHAASTWQTSGSGVETYTASTLDTAAELEAIEADSILATQVPSPDGSYDITLYEVQREDGIIYLRSEIIDHAYTINASIDIDGTPTIECAKIVDESPLLLHVEDISTSGSYNVVTFRAGETAMIYNGRYTRDMHICLRVINDVTFMSCVVLRKSVVKEQDQANVHLTSVSFDSVVGNHTFNITAYYRDSVYHSAVYTIT